MLNKYIGFQGPALLHLSIHLYFSVEKEYRNRNTFHCVKKYSTYMRYYNSDRLDIVPNPTQPQLNRTWV